MHALIDDFAWIAIELAVLSVLFILGMGFILLDEGLKALTKTLRSYLEDPRQVPASEARRSVPDTILYGLRLKFRAATRDTFTRFRAGHHKP